jgi:hypothetical protein
MRSTWIAVGALVLALVGCAGDGAETATTTSPAAWPEGSMPTAEQLAGALFTDADLAGTWTVNVPQDAPEAAISGVVTEEQQEMLPRLGLCDKASPEAKAAVDGLRWQAFRQLDMTPEDPLDFAAEDRSGHMIFAQEFLLADDPAEVEALFEHLREGTTACLGEQPVTEDGETIVSEPLEVPAIGEDRFGELDTVGEPAGGAVWYLHNAFMRDGPVLMWTDVAEIIMGEGLTAELSREEIEAILTTAADKVG